MDRLGHYIVGRRLGAGAMGEVWLAEHDLLRVSRALKVLPERFAGSSGFRERFLSEGRVLATLDHGHIVRVYDMGIEGDTYFIAMDFVSPDGSSSQSLEDFLRAGGGRLAPDAALPLLRQVCGAVAYAHERGVIHRDLKPSNVLMGPGGSPRVSDFGLARVVGEDVIHESIAASLSGSLGVQASLAGVPGVPSDPSLGGAATMGGDGDGGSGGGRGSSSESLVGTYHYMPPEVQERGPWSRAGDVYSLGVLAYVVLVGRRPVGRWKLPSELVRGLPAWWDELVDRCLRADPAERFPDGGALLEFVSSSGPSPSSSPARAVGSVAPSSSSAVGRLSAMLDEACASGDADARVRAAHALLSLDAEAFVSWAVGRLGAVLDASGVPAGRGEASLLVSLLPERQAGLGGRIMKVVAERLEAELERLHARAASEVGAGRLDDAAGTIALMRELDAGHGRVAASEELLSASVLRESERELTARFEGQLASGDLAGAEASMGELAGLKPGDGRLAGLAKHWRGRLVDAVFVRHAQAFQHSLDADDRASASESLRAMAALLPDDARTTTARGELAEWERAREFAGLCEQLRAQEESGDLAQACVTVGQMLGLHPGDAALMTRLRSLRAAVERLEADRGFEALREQLDALVRGGDHGGVVRLAERMLGLRPGEGEVAARRDAARSAIAEQEAMARAHAAARAAAEADRLARRRRVRMLLGAAAVLVVLGAGAAWKAAHDRSVRLDDAARGAFVVAEQVWANPSSTAEQIESAFQTYLGQHARTGYRVGEAQEKIRTAKEVVAARAEEKRRRAEEGRRLQEAALAAFAKAEAVDTSAGVSAAEKLKAWESALPVLRSGGHRVAEAESRVAYLRDASQVPYTEDGGVGLGLEMVWIPGGSFLMGSPAGEEGRFDHEGPQRDVSLDGFWLGKYEVTRGQFGRFVAATGYRMDAEKGGKSRGETSDGSASEQSGASWRSAGFEQLDSHPVVRVSWNDAAAFCDWLSGVSGRRYTLPSEAQWEYSCRAGSVSVFAWGADEAGGRGWLNGADASLLNGADASLRRSHPRLTVFPFDDGYVYTSPVGQFRANAFGLHDMHGNVWEWCRDWFAADFYGSSAARARNPENTTSGSYRVSRGGSWFDPPRGCRSADRDRLTPGSSNDILGFRVLAVRSGVE